jgi:hypothetical protein
VSCTGCRDGKSLDFDFSMAFQPIVDLSTLEPYAYEALIRGPEGQGALEMLSKVTDENRYVFDQRCRSGRSSSPPRRASCAPPRGCRSTSCPTPSIRRRLHPADAQDARALDFPSDRLIFEFTENEQMMDPAHCCEHHRELSAVASATGVGAISEPGMPAMHLLAGASAGHGQARQWS